MARHDGPLIRRIGILSSTSDLGVMAVRNLLIKRLRERHPDARLTLIAERDMLDAIRRFHEPLSWVDDYAGIASTHTPRLREAAVLWWRLAALRLDLLVVEPESKLACWIPRACGIPMRVGLMMRPEQQRHLTHAATLDPPELDRDIHWSRIHAAYMRALRLDDGRPIAAHVPFLRRPAGRSTVSDSTHSAPPAREAYAAHAAHAAHAVRAADGSRDQLAQPDRHDRLARLDRLDRDGDAGCARHSGLTVVMHAGGNAEWNRRWPLAMFRQIGCRLAREPRAALALIGSRDEAAENRLIAMTVKRHVPGAIVEDATGCAIEETVRRIAEADLFVGNDSGPMNLAVALGTPTVSIRGADPENFRADRVDARRHIVLSAWTACARHANGTNRCDRGCPVAYDRRTQDYPQCMAAITVDQVWNAIDRQLSRRGALHEHPRASAR